MVKVKIGGFPFQFPVKWSEVSLKQAKQLAVTKPEDIHERLSILSELPRPEHLKLEASKLLALYEIISFIEHIPDLVPNKLAPIDIANDWSYMEFEAARKIIIDHQTELGLCLYPLAEIKGLQINYVEAGAKILDGINAFLDQWKIFDLENEDTEPSALEEAAGIDRLNAFGSYSMLEGIAAKFSKYPAEIEKQPVGWVFMQYHYDKEVGRFQSNYNKLKTA